MPDSLRRAIDYPSIDHRSADFAEMFVPVLGGIKRVLKLGGGEALVFPSTGTGGWEAAIANLLSPGDTVLAARYGMFSHRWIDLCQRHGLNVEIIETPWGEGAPAEDYEAVLAADTGHRIKAVLACHNETATGVRSDIAQIRAAIDAANHPALLLVDGVSSIASMDFRMSEWGVDVAIAGSQKGFMLPAGLAIVALSDKALSVMSEAKNPRCFFDFAEMLAACGRGGYPYTPPVSLIRGLATSIDMLEAEGLANVYGRHYRIAEGVRLAVDAWGLKLCARRPALYSDTVSAVMLPKGIDGNALVAHAAEKYGIAFGIGLGEVAGKLFRIGHLGAMTDVMALSGIAAAEMVLADFDVDIRVGSGVAAAAEFYRTSVSKAPASPARAAA
eukprot:TRINITY_DN9425_c0_g2_i2.p2 TRINITY_DN9425_c0_g2~~TRINITY_DN9425_c0_g2_i2.p2  ORF type:complete len:431 (-),score=63.93 TRINITY_DN9425_c0_g2_i2:835-1995(-)